MEETEREEYHSIIVEELLAILDDVIKKSGEQKVSDTFQFIVSVLINVSGNILSKLFYVMDLPEKFKNSFFEEFTEKLFEHINMALEQNKLKLKLIH